MKPCKRRQGALRSIRSSRASPRDPSVPLVRAGGLTFLLPSAPFPKPVILKEAAARLLSRLVLRDAPPRSEDSLQFLIFLDGVCPSLLHPVPPGTKPGVGCTYSPRKKRCSPRSGGNGSIKWTGAPAGRPTAVRPISRRTRKAVFLPAPSSKRPVDVGFPWERPSPDWRSSATVGNNGKVIKRGRACRNRASILWKTGGMGKHGETRSGKYIPIWDSYETSGGQLGCKEASRSDCEAWIAEVSAGLFGSCQYVPCRQRRTRDG